MVWIGSTKALPSLSQLFLIRELQNHQIAEVGRHFWRITKCNALLKQGTYSSLPWVTSSWALNIRFTVSVTHICILFHGGWEDPSPPYPLLIIASAVLLENPLGAKNQKNEQKQQ